MSLLDTIFNEARINPDDWKKNFIVAGDMYTICVEVIAAENDGWRVQAGFSKGGKVIEDYKQVIKSEWVKTFEGAEQLANDMTKRYGIKWNPKPYGDAFKVN